MKIEKYLQQSPVFALNSAYESVISKLNQRLKDENVNLLQGLVLTALFFESQDLATPSALAKSFSTTRGNISHVLSYLEANGLVRRKLDPLDARRFYIELRPEGRKKALALIKFFDKLQSTFENSLGASICQKTTKGIYQLIEVAKAL